MFRKFPFQRRYQDFTIMEYGCCECGIRAPSIVRQHIAYMPGCPCAAGSYDRDVENPGKPPVDFAGVAVFRPVMVHGSKQNLAGPERFRLPGP